MVHGSDSYPTTHTCFPNIFTLVFFELITDPITYCSLTSPVLQTDTGPYWLNFSVDDQKSIYLPSILLNI